MIEPGGWGGICHYTYNLCQHLACRGCQVTLVSGTPYELESLPRSFRLESCIPASAPYLRKLRTILHHLRVERPDILHIQGTFSTRRDWLSLILLRHFRLPVIFTAHNILPHETRERRAVGMQLAYRLLYHLVDGVIVHGRTAKKDITGLFRLAPAKIAVIPHGDYTFADTGSPLKPSEAKRWLGLPPHCRVVLSFGAIRDYKGIPDLIDAFAQIVTEFPDAFLAIVGKPTGIDPELHLAHIQRLGLQDRVVFKPEYVPFKDIGRYFRAADIAVFPYRAICQSGALQLAYAFAKPVIVTSVGALPETIEDGQNGLVVSPADPRALAGALKHLLALSPAHLQRMGNHSLKLAQSRYSWQKVAEQTIRLHQQLC